MLELPSKFANVCPPTKPRNYLRRDLKGKLSKDTQEGTQHRPIVLFSQICADYDPGIHAYANEEGWEDHSQSSSWEFNVQQCRALLYDRPPEQPNVTYRELSAKSDKEHILGLVQTYLAILDPA